MQPGVNRVVIQTLDASGGELEQQTVDVWYDDGTVATVGGTLATDTTWTAAGGPYAVTAPLTVPSGVTLSLQPGTTVYLNAGANITVNGTGRLLAEGTESQRIRFTRQPGTAARWANFFFDGTSAESRLSYADIEYGGASGQAVRAHEAILLLDHVTFANINTQYCTLENSSFLVRSCVFPTVMAAELIHGNLLPAAGYGIIEGNWFGTTTGLNDIIDFTGGQRPNAILQILNNTFTGASDDVLDLDGTDAHIEGNIFVNVHQGTPGGDTSSAISGGRNGADTSELTIVRNLFYDCDHAVLAKEGNFYTLINNTVVRLSNSVVNFSEPARNTTGGAGALLEGNIIFNVPQLLENYTNAVMSVTLNQCVLPAPWGGAGTGNVVGDPQLLQTSNVTWQTITNDFRLRSGSPAVGTGPNGLDIGALVPAGASLAGEPISPTPLTSASLVVSGPGITHYRYRLDTNAWSAEAGVSAPILLSGLAQGNHTVYAVGKNSAGVYQDFTNATRSRTWIVNASASSLRLNEVLARNDTAVPVGAKFPDLIELYNSGPSAADLAGVGISDEQDTPFKFVFPPGATLGVGQYLVLYADNEATPPGWHLGFTLRQSGDDIYLTAANGKPIDAVVFGPQLPDRSVGRLANGSWALTQPTFGTANVAARTGDPGALKINEWLASGVLFSDDFIELYNPDPLPVALSGLYLTDNPVGAPTRHRLAPLSFIAGGGFAVFLADDNEEAGPDHLNFNLSALQGMIALLASDLSWIDCVIYGPQGSDVSQGRRPNGAVSYAFFDAPTPGAPNLGLIVPGSTVVINEVLAFNVSKKDGDTTPDYLELYNPSAGVVDLADMSLSDSTSQSRQFVFPAGVNVPSLGFLVMKCDGDAPASASNTGFGINQKGGALYLYDKLANGGALLSSVTFGLQAPDFSIGRVPDGSTNWVLTAEKLGQPNVAAPLGSAASLKVNEWMANPADGDDWFEIYNPNAQPVALGGLWLTDDLNARQKHPVARLSFIGVGAYGYQRFEADGNTASGPEHVNFSLKAGGEAVGLSLPNGVLIDGVNFGGQDLGVSQGRLPDGAANVVSFPGSSSPGDPNYVLLTKVVINEVLIHSDPPQEDTIELRNLTGSALDISGWFLSDKKHDLQKFQIPANTVIPSNGFKVFYEYQFNDANSPFAFSLNSAKGDEVYLAETSSGAVTGYRAEAKFGASENGVSFGRFQTSVGVDFTAMSQRTFGHDDEDTLAGFRLGTGLPNAYPKVGPIVISEIMYHPPDPPGGGDNVADEFIELRNIMADPVPLYHPSYPSNTWRLRDAVSFTFPPDTVLPANGLLLVVSFDPLADPAALATFRSHYSLSSAAPVLGPYTGKLNNASNSVALYKPDTPQLPPDPDAGFVPYILVDRVVYSDSAPWPVSADGQGDSLQRINADEYGNDPVNWRAAPPTPGPTTQDSDGDGLPDSWENAHGLNPNDATGVNGAGGDPDHDGLSNLEEYLAGTDPRDASSTLRLQILPGTLMMLQFIAQAGRGYTIEYRDALSTGSWQILTHVPPSSSATLVQVPDSPTGTRFYRLRTP
jgi:hypothetical protein